MVESIRELRKICQKKDDALDAEIRIHYRKISIYFTKFLLYTSITSNQTTLLSVFVAIASGIFYTFKDYLFWIAGFLLFELYLILDHVDGEIARYRKQSSMRGCYLDNTAHYFVYPFIFQCMSWGVYNELRNTWVFAIGFSLSLSDVLIRASADLWYKNVALERLSTSAKNRDSPKYAHLPIKSSGKTKNILYHVARMFTINSIVCLVLVATILDSFVPHFMIGPLKFNSKTLVLLFYGVALPLLLIIRVSYVFFKGEIIGIQSFLYFDEPEEERAYT